MAEHYQTLLSAIVANPEQRVSELTLLTKAERRQMLVEWNDTESVYPREQCIQELFAEQVARSPQQVALSAGGEQVTYRELEERANQLAGYLQSLGIGTEDLVGVCLERSVEMVVALLGILKAGGAYLPLEGSYPPERLAFMLEDTQTRVVLTSEQLRERLPQTQARLICLDREAEVIAGYSGAAVRSKVGAEQLAYVMYTSGSTGQPKGVAVTHRAVVRLVQGTDYVELGPEQVHLQLAPVSFDASTFELWGSLLNGGRLALGPAEMQSLEELSELLAAEGVTTLWLTAGLFHLLVAERVEALAGVKQLLAGGDVLSAELVKKVLREVAGCRVINGYGPTENTTFSCCYGMEREAEVGESVAIGRPIANTQVYVLDEQMQLVAVGVAGELYLGGDGLARGYYTRAEMTAEKFVPHPYSDEGGARLYKTGDVVRYREDGTLEFLGRRDEQVKIRGYRIELGEIESRLAEHEHVREAAVDAVDQGSGDKQLIAYLVAEEEAELNPGQLRNYLEKKLPAYMVPSAFVLLEALPLTSNNKIDRTALIAHGGHRPELEQAYVAPRNEIEQA